MYPPLFATLAATPAVTAVFGTAPVRVYPQGEAPAKGAAGYALPFAIFQGIGGSPENYIKGAPDSDDFAQQVDVYAATLAAARNGAKVIRDAIESQSYVTSWNGESKDADTGTFRYSFDLAWIVPRT